MRSLPVVAVCLAALASNAHAQNQPSDMFRVTLPGAVPFTVFLPEGPPAPAPETAIFNLPVGADGLFGGVLPVVPAISAVALLEPLGEPIDPGETPVLWLNNRILSDIVVSFATPGSLVAPVGVAFISDGDANLAPWAAFLLSGAVPVTVLDETGTVQDVSPFLLTPYKVEVQSDVTGVPEPGTAVLLLAGAGMIAWATRRRHLG